MHFLAWNQKKDVGKVSELLIEISLMKNAGKIQQLGIQVNLHKGCLYDQIKHETYVFFILSFISQGPLNVKM